MTRFLGVRQKSVQGYIERTVVELRFDRSRAQGQISDAQVTSRRGYAYSTAGGEM